MFGRYLPKQRKRKSFGNYKAKQRTALGVKRAKFTLVDIYQSNEKENRLGITKRSNEWLWGSKEQNLLNAILKRKKNLCERLIIT